MGDPVEEEKGTDLFFSILVWPTLLPVFNPPPNDGLHFIGKSLGSSQPPPLHYLSDQLTLTRRYGTLHEFPVAHRPLIVRIPQSLATWANIQPTELTPNSSMPPITGPGIRRRIVGHAGTNWISTRRSCATGIAPHIGNTATYKRLSLSDWNDSGLPKAFPLWTTADSKTGTAARQPLHQLPQSANCFAGLQDQVHMIRHQAESVHFDPVEHFEVFQHTQVVPVSASCANTACLLCPR